MPEPISPHLLSQITDFIASRMGLHFPDTRLRDLERGLHHASGDFGFTDTNAFIEWLISAQLTKGHIELLASHLTVGETYFFREKESFNALETDILPELIGSRNKAERRLRIWTAGCSTGEEPYSIAILLSKLIPDIKDWNITILATDINPKAMKKASEGIYTEWSFRGQQEWFKDRYFKTVSKGHYEIMPQIKKMVTFSYLNLAEDAYPSLLNNTNAMDLIFCRNVLMYFSTEQANRAVHGFYNSLVDKGWLVIGPTDGIRPLSSMFEPVALNGTIMYRKTKNGEIKFKEQEKGRIGEPEINDIAGDSPDSMAPLHYAHKSGTVPSIHPFTVSPPLPISPETAPEIEKSPDSYDEALKMFEQGRYAEAASILAGLYAHGQTDPKLTVIIAKACANQGKLDEAVTWCEKAVSADMVNPSYQYLLATIQMEQGRTEDAAKSLKKALYLNHDFVLAYFMLGNLMQAQGKHKSSKKYLQNASEILYRCRPEDVLPESEGITAGRLAEIIASMIN